jgi:haloalkane dehalogenase
MGEPTPLDRFDALPRRRVAVPGGEISTVDVPGPGGPDAPGVPVVLMHGNPTWSFQWRDVIPGLAAHRRVLAPDLLGMGRSSRLPAVGGSGAGYVWAAHVAAISAFLDTLPPHALVAHDWGASFAVRYALDHPDRVTELVLLEPLVLTETWEDYDPARRARFEAFRDPVRGRELIEGQNRMVEEVRNGVVRPMTEAEMDGYRAPYGTPTDRVVIRRFAEMKPIGVASETWADFQSIEAGLAGLRLPVRLLTVESGPLMPPAMIERLWDLLPQLEIVHLGPGRHHFQEDYADAIAAAIVARA